MTHNTIQISHNRTVKLEIISADKNSTENNNQQQYFVIEVDDNEWQNTNPDGETDFSLQALKQEPAQTPIGIFTADKTENTFSFDGDLTVTTDDQQIIFDKIS